jgi:hypothetical protein
MTDTYLHDLAEKVERSTNIYRKPDFVLVSQEEMRRRLKKRMRDAGYMGVAVGVLVGVGASLVTAFW